MPLTNKVPAGTLILSFEATKLPTTSFLSASIGTSLWILSSELSINWSVIVLDNTEVPTSV